MSKPKPKRRIVDYFMSLHYGVCHGPVDAVLEIKVKEKVAWSGEVTAPGVTPVVVNKPQLFGGDEKEGGVIGIATMLLGGAAQLLPESLAGRLGLTQATSPGFRGITSIFFHGTANSDGSNMGSDADYGGGIFSTALQLYSQVTRSRAGFMWGQNNPYLPPVSVRVRRKPVGLNAGTATIIREGYPGHDANPAHIIFECYTNTDWGLGFPQSAFDVATWNAVAQKLYDEKFGLSLGWFRSLEVEKFVAEIQDHIQAVLYEDPATGLMKIGLVRGGYDIDALTEFNPDNCTINNPERRSLEDTTNEIVVTYTDAETEKDKTVSLQDLGNVTAQGKIVSDSRNYYGVRNPELALELAARDLRSAAYPLFTCEIVADRSASGNVPGGLIRLVWPEQGIEKMACRVMSIDNGKPGSGKVIMSVMEDIFGLDQSQFQLPSGTLWNLPTSEPEPFAHSAFFTLPYPMLVSLGAGDAPYPEVYVGSLAQSRDEAVFSYVLSAEEPAPEGGTQVVDHVGILQLPYATTGVLLAQEAETELTAAQFGSFFDGDPAAAGQVFYIGGTNDDTLNEIVMLRSFDSMAGTWKLSRGLYDTVPREWPAETPVWHIRDPFVSVDPFGRAPDAPISYWKRPRTSDGVLALADTPEEVYVPHERPHLPFRPADLRIDGNSGFGRVIYEDPAPVEINLSWANRNRLMEDVVALRWSEPSVIGEDGQTTTIRVTDLLTGALIAEYPGLTGSSFAVPVAEVLTAAEIVITAFAVRDGLESMQSTSRIVEFDLTGYGFGYGENYGVGS